MLPFWNCKDFSLGGPDDIYLYILIMTDLFSNYALVVPTKDQTAVTAPRVVWSHLFEVFGYPKRILTDHVLSCLISSARGRAQLHTTPGNQSLWKIQSDPSEPLRNPHHWWKLPAVLQAYNNTTLTGLTSQYAVFGLHARLPVNWIHKMLPSTKPYTLNCWVQDHHRLEQAWESAKQHAIKLSSHYTILSLICKSPSSQTKTVWSEGNQQVICAH